LQRRASFEAGRALVARARAMDFAGILPQRRGSSAGAADQAALRRNSAGIAWAGLREPGRSGASTTAAALGEGSYGLSKSMPPELPDVAGADDAA
jgi:hypothetical protein